METDWAKANTVQLHFNLVVHRAAAGQAIPPSMLKPRTAPRCGSSAGTPARDRRRGSVALAGVPDGRHLDQRDEVAVALPEDAPRSLILHDLANGEVYECDVRWKSDEVIGLRFLDILARRNSASSSRAKRFR